MLLVGGSSCAMLASARLSCLSELNAVTVISSSMQTGKHAAACTTILQFLTAGTCSHRLVSLHNGHKTRYFLKQQKGGHG